LADPSAPRARASGVIAGGAAAGIEDRALARAAADGDRRSLELLLERHADRVHALCRRVIAHPEDALDATQEALIAIALGIRSFDGRAAFTTWVYRVATNAALDELRRRARRPVPVEELPEPAAPTSGVADHVGARIDVDAALARIPEDFLVAVVLRDLCDLDYAEIANVLDVPPGTVRSRIARGRAALSELLGNRPADETRPIEQR
jgi:RNA polymerase sigma-70 factor (ECF subfamily)